ncbi:hypothetical protein CYMTET_24554, partial [Cymbomonas tetramitiformis]
FKYLAELNVKKQNDGTLAQPTNSTTSFEKPAVPSDAKKPDKGAAPAAAPGGEVFTIQGPSKQRTKGKKKFFSKSKLTSACSVI